MKAELLKKKWPEIEKELLVGDILFFHKRRGAISSLIRRKTNSYWSHCALLFKDRQVIKYGSPLIIESYKSGIEIHRLQKYTDHFDKYDIGIKRYSDITRDQRKEFVKTFMLNNIDVPYDYGVLFAYLFSDALSSISKKLYRGVIAHIVKDDAYVCSSFIHNAFHQFKNKHNFYVPSDKTSLLEAERVITPAMIAADKDFEWVFNKQK